MTLLQSFYHFNQAYMKYLKNFVKNYVQGQKKNQKSFYFVLKK